MFTLKASYNYIGTDHEVSNFDNEAFTLHLEEREGYLGAVLTAKKPIRMNRLVLDSNYTFVEEDRFFSNGYQSWSTSTEYKRSDRSVGYTKMADWVRLGQYLATAVGDYNFTSYGKLGVFHSETFTYLRKQGSNRIKLYGSRSERQGFTIFDVDMYHDRFSIVKDVDGLELAEGQQYQLLDVAVIEDDYDAAFDQYFFDFCGFSKPKVTRFAGYTSWYNYFRNINEDIILRDLNGLDAVSDLTQIFQIDDGYSKVGDWTLPNPEKFPHGLKPIVDSIHDKGYLAGLWLAPLNVQISSELFKAHRDWLIPSQTFGPKVPQLGLINWGLTFTLDIEKPEVRDFLKHTFEVILQDWGFDMVKLDFLYTACILPRGGKTRGQLMCEAVDLLRECCGDKIILGCGVPLGACMGVFDACRIGCDANKVFGGDMVNKMEMNGEVPSCYNAMVDTIFRRCLNGRAFANDPDVFFLRDDNIDFTYEQKLDLAKVNDIFGSVLFMSDNAGQYSHKAMENLKKIFQPKDYQVKLVEYVEKDVVRIDYTEDGQEKVLQFNLRTGDGNALENF
jgi:alpha-galactosidase